MSFGRPRNTGMSLLHRTALILALILGLSAVATISVEASQAGTGRSNDEPSARGGDNLSRKLNNSNGVIPPPTQVDPGMNVKPPSDTGSMRIIPPPGSPGRDPNVQPK
jgi:hypothetical protein